jgi:hypothetical protein
MGKKDGNRLAGRDPAPKHWTSGHDPCSRTCGSVNANVAPGPALDDAHIRPPCASMIERQIDNPIPIPLGLVVKKALNN